MLTASAATRRALPPTLPPLFPPSLCIGREGRGEQPQRRFHPVAGTGGGPHTDEPEGTLATTGAHMADSTGSSANSRRDQVTCVDVADIRCWGEEKFKSDLYADVRRARSRAPRRGARAAAQAPQSRAASCSGGC